MNCQCGCGRSVKKGRKYISGHNSRVRKLSDEHKRKIGAANRGKIHSIEAKRKISKNSKNRMGEEHPLWISREIRNCQCGCGQTFECKKTSKQRFIKCHHLVGRESTQKDIKRSVDDKKKISKTMKSKGYKNRSLKDRYSITEEEYQELKKKLSAGHIGKKIHTEESKKKIGKASRVTILRSYRLGKFKYTDTRPHKLLRQELKRQNIWDNTWVNEYSFLRCSIDMANPLKGLAIFTDGDYWHANPDAYVCDQIIKNNKTAGEIWKYDDLINKFLNNHGWVVLRFWESEVVSNVSECVGEIKSSLVG